MAKSQAKSATSSEEFSGSPAKYLRSASKSTSIFLPVKTQCTLPSLQRHRTQFAVTADCASMALISATASLTVRILGIVMLPSLLLRELELLSRVDDGRLEAVELDDLGVASAAAEVRLCDAPERIALDHRVDTVSLRAAGHELQVGSVHGAANGILAIFALVDDNTIAVYLTHVPVLCLHPAGDGLATVVLGAGDLNEIALLEGGDGFRFRISRHDRLLIGAGEAIELRLLDDGGIVLVGDVGIHVSVNAVDRALGRILPHAKRAGVGRRRCPLCQPVIEALQLRIVEVVRKPVRVAVQRAVETGLFDCVTECDNHIGQDGLAEVLLRLILQIEGDRVREHAFVLLQRLNDERRFLLRCGHAGGVAVEVAADVDARLQSTGDVALKPAVEAAGAAVCGTVAEADHSKLDARCLDLLPVDFALPLGDVDAFDRSVGRRRRNRLSAVHVFDIRELAVLRPVAAIVAGDIAIAGRDLHLVRPARGAFDRETVADVHADMAFQPDRFTDLDLREIGRHVLADLDHAVRTDVGYSVGGVSRAAVDGVLVATPAPEHTFDQAHTIEAERVSAGRVDHGGSIRLLVVAVILGVAFLVRRRHRRTEAAHDIQRLIILGDVLQLVRQFNVRHHCAHPPFQHDREAAPVRPSASSG